MEEILAVVGRIMIVNLKIFEDYYSIEISLRGDQLYVFGDAKKAEEIRQVLLALIELIVREKKLLKTRYLIRN